MLAITPQASEAIKGVLDSDQVPDGALLRISAPAADDGAEAALVVSVTETPPPDDQIVEGDGVAVCVEPTAAAILDDKELDAEVVDGRVNLSIGSQAD